MSATGAKKRVWRTETPEQVSARLTRAAASRRKSYGGLDGQRFGNLLVLNWVRGGKHGAVWLCRCKCGIEIEKDTRSIKGPKLPGCKKCEGQRRSRSRTTHGEAGSNHGLNATRLYRIWRSMLARCTPGNVVCDETTYGRNNISVCAEWKNFGTFREWALSAGYADNLTIERRNSLGNYEPRNCEWITGPENASRSAITQAAKVKTLRRFTDWSDRHLPIEVLWGSP